MNGQFLEEMLRAFQTCVYLNNQKDLYTQAVASIEDTVKALKHSPLSEQVKAKLLNYQINAIMNLLNSSSRFNNKGLV